MMGQIGKFIGSAAVMFLFMLCLIFSFDSPDTLTNILLVSVNVLFGVVYFGSLTGMEAKNETD